MNNDVKHLGFINKNNICEYIDNNTLVSFIKDSTKRYIFYDACNLFALSMIIGDDDRRIYLHCYYVEELASTHDFLTMIKKHFRDQHSAEIMLRIARCTDPEDYPRPGVFPVNTLVLAYLPKAKEQVVFNIKENMPGRAKCTLKT